MVHVAPEQLISRWINYYLQKAKNPARLSNLKNDLKDGNILAVLMNQLSPSKCSLDVLKQSDLKKRIDQILANSYLLGASTVASTEGILEGRYRECYCLMLNLLSLKY